MKTWIALLLVALGSLEALYTLHRDDLPEVAMCTAADARNDPIEALLHLQLHGQH